MKQYKVLMTEPAAEDLQAITGYISNSLLEPLKAKKLVAKVKKAVMSLGKFPARFALVTDENIAVQGIRKLTVENCIVFYVKSENNTSVTVIRILHARRDWKHLL